MGIAGGGVLICAFGLGVAQGVARFVEFQRQLGIEDHGIELIAGRKITVAFHQFVFGIYRFGRALGVQAYDVLENDRIAGLANRVIGFGGNDQSEGLKIG